jgi:hypothetical protein
MIIAVVRTDPMMLAERFSQEKLRWTIERRMDPRTPRAAASVAVAMPE